MHRLRRARRRSYVALRRRGFGGAPLPSPCRLARSLSTCHFISPPARARKSEVAIPHGKPHRRALKHGIHICVAARSAPLRHTPKMPCLCAWRCPLWLSLLYLRFLSLDQGRQKRCENPGHAQRAGGGRWRRVVVRVESSRKGSSGTRKCAILSHPISCVGDSYARALVGLR